MTATPTEDDRTGVMLLHALMTGADNETVDLIANNYAHDYRRVMDAALAGAIVILNGCSHVSHDVDVRRLLHTYLDDTFDNGRR